MTELIICFSILWRVLFYFAKEGFKWNQQIY